MKHYQERPAEELNDLANDPLEQNNLATDPTQKKTPGELRTALDGWLKQQDDPFKVYGEPKLLDETKDKRPKSPE